MWLMMQAGVGHEIDKIYLAIRIIVVLQTPSHSPHTTVVSDKDCRPVSTDINHPENLACSTNHEHNHLSSVGCCYSYTSGNFLQFHTVNY